MNKKIENMKKIEVNITVSPYNVFKTTITNIEKPKKQYSSKKTYTSLTESFVSI